MNSPLRILHLEDNTADADLIKELLFAEGIDASIMRVEQREEFALALRRGDFDMIICDYSLPSFDGLTALKLARESHPDIPFIFVSGGIGEDRAIESLRNGATDYILKDRLSRLPSAVLRAAHESEERNERKRLENQLVQAQKMETIGTLAGGIAHDFNNILGIILGYVSLMKRGTMHEEQFGEAIGSMTKAVDRGATLVRQLLTFARKTDVVYSPVNVNSIADEVITMCSQTFPKHLDFILQPGQGIPPVIADPNQLHQALLNLCINARDAMPEAGTITLHTGVVTLDEVRQTLPEASSPRYACIVVSDTGSGMDQETRERIFEPFFTTKGVGKGTGLGLAMVYGMINSHRGLIAVESELGKGSTFRLYLPAQEEGRKTVNFTDVEEGDVIKGGNETILLVEDEDTMVELIRAFLQAYGYTVLVAKDGIAAVEAFRQNSSDIAIVLTDLGLPKLGGWEAFQMMKEIKPGIASIVATGYVDSRSRSEMLRNGAKNIVQKPFVPSELLKVVRETLDAIRGGAD